MGSQLSGIAPAQILNAENYLTEIPDFQFETSLGSTRFLKVARARHKEGYVVIKVFVVHDPSLPLESYQNELIKITNSLKGFPNTLPFEKTLLTERAGLLIRPFVHDNLYDRISTRPFLNTIEKKWIIFQLLCALEQMHSVKVCHGDIKTENILVTSWNWILLTDIARFKPVFLPVDNPADFNYFFDTSRRRTCNLAPERFVDSMPKPADSSTNISDGDTKSSNALLPMEDFPNVHQFELTEAMDIFSAGCVMAELFCEGAALFDLSQLLAYRTLDFNPEWKLYKIDENIKDMVNHMIQLDGHLRFSAKEYISKYRGVVFPEEFYSFLRTYLSHFASQPVMTSDEKIAKLAADLELIKDSLYHKPQVDIGSDEEISAKKNIPHDDNCFVMIVSLVTSCVRSLKFSVSKLTSLSLMLELSHYVCDEIILELILPYMFYFVNDPIARVRAQMISTITRCVDLVTTLPRNEVNIFPEYILPNLSQLANDTEVIVQCAFAENVSSLAETALRFLELAQFSSAEQNEQSVYVVNYDVELHALHELIQSKVVALLTNSDNIVKRTLMENGLTRLCVFFGRQKANDVLLSHIITFLNDKQDWQLRAAFYDSIVGVAVYIGWHCLSILKPLLQQGLKDVEEFVVVRALQAITSLVKLALLQKPIINEFIADVVPFLIHPNQWIRYACVGYIVACAKAMSLVDVHCRLAPSIFPFLKQPIIQLDNQTVILAIVDDSIPRTIYDYVVKSPHARTLLTRLEKHHEESNDPFIPKSSEAITQIIRKLKSQGMTASIEKKLILLKETIFRLSAIKTNPDSQISQQELSYPGLLDLSSLPTNQRSMEILLYQQLMDDKPDNSKSSNKRASQALKQQQQQSANDLRYRHQSESEAKPDSLAVSKSENEISSIQPKTAQCKKDVQKLTLYKRHQYVSDMKRRNVLHTEFENENKSTGWKPKGQLVAHLHEHKAGINRIITNESCTFFATASEDSTVKLWDTQRLDGKALTTRSKFTYTKQVGNINCLTFCHNSSMVACSSDDASIHVFRIDGSSGQGQKLPLVIEKKLSMHEEGCAVDMHHFDTGIESIITYATTYGYIIGWDLRQPKEKSAWKFKNNPKLGLITSFAVDPLQCWLTCGTSDGALVCWDLRFQLPITQIIHPKNAGVRRVSCHPSETSWVVASFQGNNEVSMWDLETSAKKKTLWASINPPLCHTQPTNETVTAMYSSRRNGSPFFVTAGSDKRIRYWDLLNAESSTIIAGSATDNLDNIALKYNNRLIDGTEVIYETYEKRRSNVSYEDHPKRGPDESPYGHLDCITDLAFTKSPQNFLISGSRDGVIKVWK